MVAFTVNGVRRELGVDPSTPLLWVLREHLKLELSESKTLITHARTQAARFLGYEVVVHHNSTRRTKGQRSPTAPSA